MCPGQGSQTPGFLTPWLDLPGVEARLGSLGEAAGLDLRAHGTTSDAETIKDTAVAQPLIVAASLVALRALLDDDDARASDVAHATAGHSVGEFAAAATADVFSDEEAVGLVAERARLMAEAAAVTPTGMAAVLGGDPDEVLAAIETAGLWPANVNGGGQVVAAGALPDLEKLAAAPPARARVVPLQVAGAFHTPYMQDAADRFAAVADRWTARDPRMTLLSNADGASYAQVSAPTTATHGVGRDVLRRLTEQIAAPVRWDLCQQSLADAGITALVELAPAGVLSGLARRTLPGVETVAIKSPDDLDAARDLVRRHGRTGGVGGATDSAKDPQTNEPEDVA